MAPELSSNADQAALTVLPIRSLTLNSPIYANGTDQGFNLGGNREFADFVPCFTVSTQIATIKGEVNVENIKVGDRVFTRDNGMQTVKWVGQRKLSAVDLASTPSLQPIAIKTGVFGAGMPQRTMLISPNHRVLMTGYYAELYFDETEVLIAAKHLTHLDGVEHISTTDVTYVHIMFDRHEIVLSDGIWSESFLPGRHTMRGIGEKQRDEIYALFPALKLSDDDRGWRPARPVLRKHEAEIMYPDA